MDFDREYDAAVRNAAFGWLASQVSGEDGVVSRDVLANGFGYGGERVRFGWVSGYLQAGDDGAAAVDNDVTEWSV